MADDALRATGMAILKASLGPVQALRFLALLSRDPFDYQSWRDQHFAGMSLAGHRAVHRRGRPGAGGEAARRSGPRRRASGPPRNGRRPGRSAAAGAKRTAAGAKAAANRPAARPERRRREPETLRLRSIAPTLTVDDAGKSLAWYTGVLGFVSASRIDSMRLDRGAGDG
jgi:hypothetical protein